MALSLKAVPAANPNFHTAGMSVHAPHERTALLDLIEIFQRRVRWPADSLRKELELEYQKDGLSAFAG